MNKRWSTLVILDSMRFGRVRNTLVRMNLLSNGHGCFKGDAEAK